MRRALTIAATVMVAAVVATTVPASAATGEKISIRIEGDAKTQKRYPGMPINDASSEFTGDPETCAAVPWCTVVPLEVLLPDTFDPEINEFVLAVRLSWNDAGFSAGGQSAQGNDLDMYILREEEDEDGEVTYVEVGRSAGASEPETAKLFTPAKKDYLIVVYNFLGINEGFDLALSYVDASIEDPGDFGSFPAARPAGGGAGGSTFRDVGDDAPSTSPSSPRPSFGSLPRPVPSSPSGLSMGPDGFSVAGAPPILPTVGTTFDLALPAGGSRSLATDLAGGETQDVFRPRVASSDPRPVSGLVLGFWLGVVPLVLAATAAILMMRRRPAALTMQISSVRT